MSTYRESNTEKVHREQQQRVILLSSVFGCKAPEKGIKKIVHGLEIDLD
jgi:hypothetical protein